MQRYFAGSIYVGLGGGDGFERCSSKIVAAEETLPA